MSLISDTDFLIHSIRLSYLRNSEDPYASRIVSLSAAHSGNQHVLAAGLGDSDRWPELLATASPQPSDDEDPTSHAIRSPSGFPGATGLKYTQTIVGPNRSGALGMRVSGKRASLARQSRALAVSSARDAHQASVLSEATALDAAAPPNRASSAQSVKLAVEGPTPDTRAPVAAEEEPEPPKQAIFVPKFKGAAEMEARRRKRIMDRKDALTARTGVPAAPAPPIDSSDSSASEDAPQPLDSDDDSASDFEIVPDADDDLDEDFPDFMSRDQPSGSEWDAASATSSGPEHSPQVLVPSRRPRLSPVAEAPRPAPPLPASSPADPSIFSKRAPAPAAPAKSTLTALLAASSASTNPFADLYGAISGKAEGAQSTTVTVFFPKSAAPEKPMALRVKKDATVEEVVGFALWSYWEEGWAPKLDEGLEGAEEKEDEEGERWKVRMSTIGWIMRIAEEDGEVDEDFPPPDRTGKISKFNFDAYAILEASPAQIQQNKVLEAKIQRPARLTVTKKPSVAADASTAFLLPAGGSSLPFSSSSLPLGSFTLSGTLSGPQLFLRVRVADVVDAVHVSTTIPVSAGMYMQEALEMVCRKRRLNPKEFALLLGDMSILIPLDRTVASLQGKSDLVLVKRSMLPSLGIDELKRTGRSTDPNASIFKRVSEIPEQALETGLDLTTQYKKYTIYKNMLVGRQERTLAIDGAYIHIMPSSGRAKAVFESGRTQSFHVKDVACQQSSKVSATFKLIVHRDDGKKRFDFEAESPQQAKEIVETIKGLRNSLDRAGTVKASRRSRHVG